MAGEQRGGQRPHVPEVHEVAARGFTAEAAAYDSARPSYPPDAVRWLIDNLGISPGRRVVDLAAGTGKLTALLARAGARLIAVEPVAAMGERLRAKLPGVPLLAGVAEAMPFAGGSLDAVVVAQAFHWFDPDRAMAELSRVIGVGGRLGLIWNVRDRSVGWVDEIWSVMDRVERHAPWQDHGRDRSRGSPGRPDGSLRRTEPDLTSVEDCVWSGWTRASFSHVHVGSQADVVDRLRSVSHIAVLPQERQHVVLDEIRAILGHRPETSQSDTVGIPYVVDVMVAERLR
jgi:SAM-dependent methyltransferase